MTIRFRHILLYAVSLLCLSCSGDDSFTSVMEYPVEVELGSDMTKVGIDGNDLFWESGDQVAFRAAGASGVTAVAVLTLNDVDSGLGKAKFKGSVLMTEMPVSCEFAYPADAFAESGKTVYDYSVQDGTHKPYLYGTQEYSENGMECTLGHVGGLIRIKVADGVESLSVSSNSGTYLTREDGSSSYDGQKISKVTLGAEGAVTSADDASHFISVSVPAGSDVVYAFVPAIKFVDGISIVCNHEDGSKMFKSFSTTGGNYSSYDFDAGSAIDVDLSEYSGFKADCTCIGYHAYDDSNILTGTDVLLTDFTFSGSPSKIIDQWGVAIYDSKNNFIRWTSENSIFNKDNYINQDESEKSGKKMDDYTGNWPLLIPGEQYSVYAICSINGHTLQFKATDGLSVGEPNIQVTPIAETSWTYRSNPEKANSCGNNTIERLGVKVNVADNILNHITTNYGFKARMQNTTSGADSGELTMNTNFTSTSALHLSYNTTTREYDLKNGDGLFVLGNLEWKAHNVVVSVSFAGNTYSSHTTAYVTGLPFRHDFRSAEGLDGVGSIVSVSSGRTMYYAYNGYELNYYETFVGRKVSAFYSRTFAVPNSIDVKFSSSFSSLNTGQSVSKFKSTVYTGLTKTQTPSKSFSKSITSDTTGNMDDADGAAASSKYTVEGTGSLDNATFLSASAESSDKMFMVECVVFLGAFEILYN